MADPTGTPAPPPDQQTQRHQQQASPQGVDEQG